MFPKKSGFDRDAAVLFLSSVRPTEKRFRDGFPAYGAA
jgi:hypothetical protein